MPISKKPGEQKSDWISRCISHEMNKKNPMKQDQAVAACNSMWISMARLEERLRVVREYKAKKCKTKK